VCRFITWGKDRNADKLMKVEWEQMDILETAISNQRIAIHVHATPTEHHLL